MDPQTGSTSGTLSRRVRSTRNVSGRHPTGRCWKGSLHHLTGRPPQGPSLHHRMTGLSYGQTLYQTGLHRQCKFRPGRGCLRSRWSLAWWTPRLHQRKASPLLRILRLSDPSILLPRQGRTFVYSCRNLSKNIFHLLDVIRVLKLCPALTDSSALIDSSPTTGIKTSILLCEVRRSRLRYSEVSDCTADYEKTKMNMYKRTIILYNRSKRFLFIRRIVASANCKCIIPPSSLAAPTLILCDS